MEEKMSDYNEMLISQAGGSETWDVIGENAVTGFTWEYQMKTETQIRAHLEALRERRETMRTDPTGHWQERTRVMIETLEWVLGETDD